MHQMYATRLIAELGSLEYALFLVKSALLGPTMHLSNPSEFPVFELIVPSRSLRKRKTLEADLPSELTANNEGRHALLWLVPTSIDEPRIPGGMLVGGVKGFNEIETLATEAFDQKIDKWRDCLFRDMYPSGSHGDSWNFRLIVEAIPLVSEQMPIARTFFRISLRVIEVFQ